MWSRKGVKSKRYKGVFAGSVDDAQLPPGILNVANDCFANSVLQSVRLSLRHFFLSPTTLNRS